MNTAQATIPSGYMQDARGRLVPEDQVREQDKLRDQCVTDLVKQAQAISQQLTEFKRKALADIADLLQIAADKYEVTLGGKKGNVSLSSYNGRYKIQRVFAEQIQFSEELEAAQQLFAECLDKWTASADVNIRALVDRAFRTTRSGQIKTAELLGLLQLEIDDTDWQRATNALKDSIRVGGSTVYVRVYERIEDTDKYRQIALDLASV
ncbi:MULTISPECIES: DUF3164 family protein [unclassified Oceanobacter]|uniref:DUF3164 family protein n=1 Tax=unclassified Oceanobacter TaxID=2620260 RepID=UPI00273668C3|nr:MULTISPECIES: DUF3164 family protein [unclassified Oceanobacter]MDP2607973.1 DUF3164 family protein [Oceanobacter sp. 1_MG-2023]MDP2611365.1 DUF3164 family protein [Oceanobacter sp. 2_MG-2023]